MFKLLSRELKTIYPLEAQELLKLNNFPGQRTIKRPHVAKLSRTINNKTFLVGEIAIAKEKYNSNRKKLANGQHQLNAVLYTQKPIPVVFEVFECETPQDFSELYRQFDNNAARSLTDKVKPEAVALGLDWPVKIVSLILTGAIRVANKSHADSNEKVELLQSFLKQGSFVNYILHESIEDKKTGYTKDDARI